MITFSIFPGINFSIPIPASKSTALLAVTFSTQPAQGSLKAAPIIDGLTIDKVIFYGFFFFNILSTKPLVKTYVLGKGPKIFLVFFSSSSAGICKY